MNFLSRQILKSFRVAGFSPAAAFLLQQKTFSCFAFIHINKCGGTSVENALNIPVKLHDTALERRQAIGKRWDKVFTFSVVRHPYDRVASLYRYRVKTNQNNMGDKHISISDWVKAVWQERDERYYDIPKMFCPCHDWLVDENDSIIVDYVAKLERIDLDWPVICEKIGIVATLPRLNETAPKKKTVLATIDAQSRSIIDSAFKRDFEKFDYK